MQGEADRVRKLGMEEYMQADTCSFNHHQLFRILQNLTLTYRLSEPVVSLGMYNLYDMNIIIRIYFTTSIQHYVLIVY